MCSNYEPMPRSKAIQLGLLEPTFEYASHIFPGGNAPVYFQNEDELEWRNALFGLVPTWAKDLKITRSTYNARIETIDEKPSFRNAWSKSKFCLIPAQKIYEPRYFENKSKSEWWSIERDDDQPFTIAGMYETAKINDEIIRSFTMITINADDNEFMRQFHKPDDEKRSVVVVPEKLRKEWLKADHAMAKELLESIGSIKLGFKTEFRR